MENPIKHIKLNNLEYNPNRDPQIYRKVVNKPFSLQVDLAGSGNATVSLIVDGETIAESTVKLPGRFEANPTFDTAGTRVGKLLVSQNGDSFETYLRFDVLEEAYHG